MHRNIEPCRVNSLGNDTILAGKQAYTGIVGRSGQNLRKKNAQRDKFVDRGENRLPLSYAPFARIIPPDTAPDERCRSREAEKEEEKTCKTG